MEIKNIKCPLEITHNIINGKWKISIICLLKNSVMRFNELQKALPEIQKSYLTQQLKELEEYGIVHRQAYLEVPPKVEYSLTEIGNEFLKVMDVMNRWGEYYIKHIERK
ncbi:winged helix-turn-helix transcriptional regulator [Alkaliphilus peptidifermentans]|uniref:Transcriptional regulator, HxlR family n=1 Tax=Alkaliphilus peptidifermentans DSM 18978 TaxID=1120976 RepID=A0A1G5ACU2_9FIRM|nr:helix-turn-helix domain-containing protein [Alkaliphilus peptidifermentans]SCX75673.1 transcriptional regulator, HxlR family [Alkaliphilus peptidifermentans DSM 18978]